jgi:PAS domain S-box-containing protein
MSDSQQSMMLAALVALHTDRAVMVLDPAGSIEWINNGFSTLLGYTANEVIGKPWSVLNAYATDSTSGKLIEQRIRAGVGADVELLHYTKVGDPLWIRSEIRPVRGEDGGLEHFVVLEVDILEEERAARRVREDEERWMLALEVNDVAVWDLDVVARSVLGSKRWEELLAFTPGEQAIGDGALLGHRVHPDDCAAFTESWNTLLSGSVPQLNAGIRLRSTESYRYMRMRARVVRRDAAGSALRVVGTLVDIHEPTLMQMQAANASKLESIGELAAGIAHEINTPTQYVGDNVRFLSDGFKTICECLDAYRELLAQHADSPLGLRVSERLTSADLSYLQEEIPKAITQSMEGIERIARIVGAMKEFSHPGQERTPTDINHAIANTITVATNEWKYVAKVQTDFDASLPHVPVVPGEFNQVILNIIVNAAHAIGESGGAGSRAPGHIRVTTRQIPGWAEILIADNGCGMPPHIQQKIFDPFFTTKPVGKGTGQGLSIAHAVIVKKHRGTITVDSEPGQGTTFTIRIPLNSDVAAQAA